MIKSKLNGTIQGLRAVAILAVIGFHLNIDHFRSGYLGVDIFLVVSGYLIFRMFQKNGGLTKRSLFFYLVMRSRRIFPALLFNLLVAIPFVYFYTAPYLHEQIAKSIFASLFWVANLFFFFNTDYFTAINDKAPFLHFWSISLEIQFYLIAPIVALITNKSKFPKLVLMLLIIFSFVASVFYIHRYEPAAFYLLPMRLWEFLCGGIILQLSAKYENKIYINFFREVHFICFTLLIFITSSSFFEKPSLLGNLTICICTSIILFGVEKNSSIRIYASRPFLFIGKISYSLYLSHYIIIFLFGANSNQNRLSFAYLLFLILVILFISSLSYFGVEKPFLTTRLHKDRFFIVLIVTTGIAILALSQFLFFSSGTEIWVRTRTGAEERKNLTLISNNAKSNFLSNRFSDGKCIYYSPTLDKRFKSRFKACTGFNRKAVLIFGDSHAMNIHNIYALSGVNSVIFTLADGGCRPYESKKCFYNDLLDFSRKNANRISTMIYHQSGSHLMLSKYGAELTANDFNYAEGIKLNRSAISRVRIYLKMVGNRSHLIWLGPFLEPQVDLRNPLYWKKSTTISPFTVQKFSTLDSFLKEKSQNRIDYKYVSTLNIFRFSKDRLFQPKCLVWNDLDHFSYCGEILLSVQERKFLAKLNSKN